MKTRLSYLLLVLLAALAVQAQELVVCTYNVRYKNNGDTDAGNGWNTRRTYLINLMNFQQPDLLGVQEALNAQMTDMANGLKGYAYIGVGRDNGTTGGEYSAIFYRTERMILLDHGDFWLSDTPYKASKGFPSKGGGTSYKRICTWGKFLDKATGSVIYHFNTHMDLDETNRQQSYYLIKQKIQEIASTTAPVIVSGDYNAVQTGDAYKLFYNSGFLYDSFHRAKQKFMTNGTCPGFNANNYSTVSSELRRIDHIFVTRAFNVEHYGVLNPCYYSTSGTADYHERAYSDHSPVIAKLTIRGPETLNIPTELPPVVDGVYQLSTPEELLTFSFIVNGIAGFAQNTAAKAVLLSDISMKGMTSWLPIGTESKPFTGTFDGQGHTIRDLAVKTGKSLSGLFGKTQGATIKNFHVGGTVTISEGYSDHGAVAYADGTTISDVHSELTFTTGKANDDTQHIGGIAGSLFNRCKVDRCSFSGRILLGQDHRCRYQHHWRHRGLRRRHQQQDNECHQLWLGAHHRLRDERRRHPWLRELRRLPDGQLRQCGKRERQACLCRTAHRPTAEGHDDASRQSLLQHERHSSVRLGHRCQLSHRRHGRHGRAAGQRRGLLQTERRPDRHQLVPDASRPGRCG